MVLSNCDSCPLKGSRWIPGRGVKHPQILICGEGPGNQEERQGKVFVGPSGKILQRVIKLVGLQGIYLTNTTLCKPKQVSQKEAAAYCCRKRLIGEILDLKPPLIIALGAIATDTLLGKGKGITKRRGRVVFSEELQTWVLPTVHPAAVLRSINYYRDFVFDFKKAKAWANPDYQIKYNLSNPDFEWVVEDDLDKILGAIQGQEWAVLDTETPSLEDYEIIKLVISTRDKNFVVPAPLCASPELFNRLLKTDLKWIGHSSKFDRKVIKTCTGVDFPFAFDTLLAHYTLDERNAKHKGGHGLKSLARIYLNAPDWDAAVENLLGRGKKRKSYAELPDDVLDRYTALDGFYTYKLFEYFSRILEKYPKQKGLLENILIPASNVLADVELRGTRIDSDEVNKVHGQLSGELEELKSSLNILAGHQFNPNSHQQVGRILFDELGLPQIKGRSTDKDVLAELRGNSFVDMLQKYRKMSKLLSTYVVPLLGAERVYTNFLLFGTVSGRLSSRGPNLQNQPSDTPIIRNFFIPDEGKKLSYSDLSQAEYRVMAVLSQDPFLIRAYKQSGDLHSEMAASLFGSDFNHGQRAVAKTINFGLAYGMGVRKLATDLVILGLDPRRADSIVREYFTRIPKLLQWRNSIQDFVKRNHYLESSLGRRRRFPYIPYRFSAEIGRQAVNFLPQSLASDVTLLSLIKMVKQGIQVLLTVHDSILIQAPEKEVEDTKKLMIDIMESTAQEILGSQIPFVATAAIGNRWGELDV